MGRQLRLPDVINPKKWIFTAFLGNFLCYTVLLKDFITSLSSLFNTDLARRRTLRRCKGMYAISFFFCGPGGTYVGNSDRAKTLIIFSCTTKFVAALKFLIPLGISRP